MPGPNFVFIITDQQRADSLGCTGHPVVRTPALDGLAGRGTLFTNTYVASPVCMPNRASLMTGRMPSLHGVRLNGVPLSRRNVTFVELLRAAGYNTGLIGKSHLQNFSDMPAIRGAARETGKCPPPPDLAQAVRQEDGAGYDIESPDFWDLADAAVETPFYGFDHVELITGHGDRVGGDYRRWLLEREPAADKLTGPENQLSHDYTCPQAVRTALPEALYSTSFIAERAEAWLAERSGDDRPFFLNVSFPDPHHPLNPPGRFWDMYDPSDMPVPAAFRVNDWTPPAHVAAVLEEREAGRAKLNGMNTIGITAREAQEAQALTCGMVTMIDEAVGRILAALEASGRSGDTVVIFTSDHGDNLGDHRLLLKGAEPYQQVTRVPLIWAEPGAEAHRTRELASTIDISASVLDRAGLAPYAGMQGQSLLPVVRGEAKGRDNVLIQYEHQRPHPAWGVPPRVHTIVEDGWRLSLFPGEAGGELYDLEEDPDELRNLWDAPEAAPRRAMLFESLARAEMACVDTVPLPTGLA